VSTKPRLLRVDRVDRVRGSLAVAEEGSGESCNGSTKSMFFLCTTLFSPRVNSSRENWSPWG